MAKHNTSWIGCSGPWSYGFWEQIHGSDHRRLFNRLNRLHKDRSSTSEERQNLINIEGLYKLITNHNKGEWYCK